MNTNLQVRDVVTCTENEIEEKEEEGSRAPQRFLKTSRDRAVRPESFVNGIGGGALREMEQTGEMPVNIATGEISEQTT